MVNWDVGALEMVLHGELQDCSLGVGSRLGSKGHVLLCGVGLVRWSELVQGGVVDARTLVELVSQRPPGVVEPPGVQPKEMLPARRVVHVGQLAPLGLWWR